MEKPWQVIALIALTGFAMTACGNAARPAPLTLSGQVLELIDGGHYLSDTLSGILTSSLGSEGTVINGQLDFTIGVPDLSHLQSIEYLFQTIFNPGGINYTNVIFSVTGAKAASFHTLNGTTKNGDTFIIQRVGNSIYGAIETVSYIFVDRDVTISAEGKVAVETGFITFDNMELQLQRGWNVLYHKADFFKFPFIVTIEVINRNDSPYYRLIWLR